MKFKIKFKIKFEIKFEVKFEEFFEELFEHIVDVAIKYDLCVWFASLDISFFSFEKKNSRIEIQSESNLSIRIF